MAPEDSDPTLQEACGELVSPADATRILGRVEAIARESTIGGCARGGLPSRTLHWQIASGRPFVLSCAFRGGDGAIAPSLVRV